MYEIKQMYILKKKLRNVYISSNMSIKQKSCQIVMSDSEQHAVSFLGSCFFAVVQS